MTNPVLVQMHMEVYSAQRIVCGNAGGKFVPYKPAAVCVQVEVGGVVLLVKQGLRFKGCFVALRKTLCQDVILPYCDLGSRCDQAIQIPFLRC